MSGHSVGPWKWEDILDDDRNVAGVRLRCGDDGIVVGADLTDSVLWQPVPADARLIAAAPELLELVRRLAAYEGDDHASLTLDAQDLLARIDGGE